MKIIQRKEIRRYQSIIKLFFFFFDSSEGLVYIHIDLFPTVDFDFKNSEELYSIINTLLNHQ